MRTSKSLLSAAVLLIICCCCGLAAAQEADAAYTQPTPQSTSPQFTYTFGAGNDFTRVIVSTHGNVTKWESPAAQNHFIAKTVSTPFGPATIQPLEGYAVILGTSSPVAYWDGGGLEPASCGGSSNSWGTATYPAVNTVRRTSCDGALTLTQVFAFSGPNKQLQITMTLKNNRTTATAPAILLRAFDANMNADAADDRFDRTPDSVWAKDVHALMLTATSGAVAHTTGVVKFSTTANPFTALTTSEPTPTPAGDYVGRVHYTLGAIAAGASKTVVFTYKRF